MDNAMDTPTGQADPATARCMDALARYPEPNEEISPRDHMYNSSSEPKYHSYRMLGRQALDCIRVAMVAAQKDTATSILDLPSGHGRVLRLLKADFPAARLTACDIDHNGVDYCAAAFGATPLYGREGPPDRIEEEFDLIWCGSLLTHVDAPQWTEFLDFFEASLVPGGLLVFTSHGRSVAAKLHDPEDGLRYMPNPDRLREIVRGYDETGFGYADYDYGDSTRESLSLPPSFGISATSPSWVFRLIEKRPQLQVVTYMENRWGAHDVVGCMRVDAVEEGRTPMRVLHGPAPDPHDSPTHVQE
jgi:SAM-dependent methyltransferase